MIRDLWWRHARAPLCLLAPLAILLAITNADFAIAGTFFDSARGEWLGAHSWWIDQFVHTGGRWAIRIAVLTAIAIALAAHPRSTLHSWRRPAACFALSVVASIGLVGLLKILTNVDCPWDLADFGGKYPSAHLFADRPGELRRGQCFPAAHAASGYALVALYFALRERDRLLARGGLALGIATGLVFGFCQQARGAHFLSHDLWSACISWIVALSIYAFGFKASLWNQFAPLDEPTQSPRHENALAACRLAAGGPAAVRDFTGGGVRWQARRGRPR